jgi:hypothetical protein
MQAPISFGLIGALVGIALLALVLGVVSTVPLLAAPFFFLGLVVFFVWRGRQRAKPALGQRYGDRVPSTEEAAADPVADSGVRDAARARTGGHGA